MYYNNRSTSKLLPDLLRDSEHPQLNTISDVDRRYTFEAEGVNVDYILLLSHKKNSDYKTEKHTIDKPYQDVFDEIERLSSNTKAEDFEKIINYIKSTELIPVSRQLAGQTDQEYFNYCITLADRYIPKIHLDIEKRLNVIIFLRGKLDEAYFNAISYLEKKEYDNEYERDRAIKKTEDGYLGNKEELAREVCNYISLWIHAYRFLQARKKLSIQENIISYSHRYQGWSKPRYKFNDDLTIEFITNFGYGNSSYFYLLLIYKGIQIFPFMEWVNYKYAEVSEMVKYTEKYHTESIVEIHRSKNPKYRPSRDEPTTKRVVRIDQKYWEKAFLGLVRACKVCEEGADAFIQVYITSALDSLVDKLEEVFELKDKKSAAKYRDFNHEFSKNYKGRTHVEKVSSMSVKGAIISGTLDFMGEITKLKEIIDTEVYVKKIESLNLRVLPALQQTIPECKKLNSGLKLDIEKQKSKLVDIWINQGLKEYELIYDYSEISEEDKSKFKDLKEKHIEVTTLKNNLERDLQHSIDILNSINRYIRNIEKYFSLTR